MICGNSYNRYFLFRHDEYNYSFIGKVYRFKQIGQTFVIYLEDLGWKFVQKVPDEFRKTYIAGQTLDDAFQAICEFMGVDFAYSIDNSIVGNHAGIFFAGQSCFIKLSPCFAATFCDFLSVECFFFGDFIIASGIFCDFVVEYSQCNLCLVEF